MKTKNARETAYTYFIASQMNTKAVNYAPLPTAGIKFLIITKLKADSL